MTDILIIEDNKELADLLCDFLRAENYTVSVAQTGEKALSLYERYGARLIVLDIMLSHLGRHIVGPRSLPCRGSGSSAKAHGSRARPNIGRNNGRIGHVIIDKQH